MTRAARCGLLLASGLYFLSLCGGAAADSGPLRDPTGCAGGSAVANCRSVPPQWRPKSNSEQRNKSNRKSTPLMPRTWPLPSQKLQRTPPPASSTGLDKGSTGLKGGSSSHGKRVGH